MNKQEINKLVNDIVIDDGSVTMFKEFFSKLLVNFTEGKGYTCSNSGISFASGQYISYEDAFKIKISRKEDGTHSIQAVGGEGSVDNLLFILYGVQMAVNSVMSLCPSDTETATIIHMVEELDNYIVRKANVIGIVSSCDYKLDEYPSVGLAEYVFMDEDFFPLADIVTKGILILKLEGGCKFLVDWLYNWSPVIMLGVFILADTTLPANVFKNIATTVGYFDCISDYVKKSCVNPTSYSILVTTLFIVKASWGNNFEFKNSFSSLNIDRILGSDAISTYLKTGRTVRLNKLINSRDEKDSQVVFLDRDSKSNNSDRLLVSYLSYLSLCSEVFKLLRNPALKGMDIPLPRKALTAKRFVPLNYENYNSTLIVLFRDLMINHLEDIQTGLSSLELKNNVLYDNYCKLKEENSSLKSEIEGLMSSQRPSEGYSKEEYEQLRLENEKLKSSVEILSSKLAKTQVDNKSLRGMLESLQNGTQQEEETTLNIVTLEEKVNFLNNYKIAIVGSVLDSYKAKLKSLGLCNFKVIDASNKACDLSNYDYIVLFTSYLAHKLVYKVMSTQDASKVIYFNDVNVNNLIDVCYNQISEEVCHG